MTWVTGHQARRLLPGGGCSQSAPAAPEHCTCFIGCRRLFCCTCIACFYHSQRALQDGQCDFTGCTIAVQASVKVATASAAEIANAEDAARTAAEAVARYSISVATGWRKYLIDSTFEKTKKQSGIRARCHGKPIYKEVGDGTRLCVIYYSSDQNWKITNREDANDGLNTGYAVGKQHCGVATPHATDWSIAGMKADTVSASEIRKQEEAAEAAMQSFAGFVISGATGPTAVKVWIILWLASIQK